MRRYSPYYKDITDEFLEKLIPYGKEVSLAKLIIKNGKEYYHNNRNKFNFNNNEVYVALWFRRTIGGKIELRFEIGEDRKISSSDYLIDGEEWDLKEISGNSPSSFLHSTQKKRVQSQNYIFDLSNSSMSESVIIENLRRLFKFKDWIGIIVLKKNNDLLGIYEKVKKKK